MPRVTSTRKAATAAVTRSGVDNLFPAVAGVAEPAGKDVFRFCCKNWLCRKKDLRTNNLSRSHFFKQALRRFHFSNKFPLTQSVPLPCWQQSAFSYSQTR